MSVRAESTSARRGRRAGSAAVATLASLAIACSATPNGAADAGDAARAIDARTTDVDTPDARASDAIAPAGDAGDAAADAAPLIAPGAWPVPALGGAPFASSFGEIAAGANRYWTVYGVAEGTGGVNGVAFANNPAWAEWDAIKFAWSGHGTYRDQAMAYLRGTRVNGVAGTTGAQPGGYVWSWGHERETWPDDNAFHHGVGSYHFDQVPRFINAVRLFAVWTRDAGFLAAMLPVAESVMDDYLLGTMHGATGVVIDPGAEFTGNGGGRGSTYMDEIASGGADGWVNAAFYTALGAMAELEAMAGNASRRDRYAALAAAFPARYTTALWNGATQRFAGWRATDGALHDAGYTYVNLEALARGLGNVDQAQRVFDWLASPAEPSGGGPHAGSTDVYQEVFGPRTTTASVPLGDWDGWSDLPTGRFPYGTLVENGSAMLWTVYYDTLARLRYADADAAFARTQAMLVRAASDSHYLTFDPPGRSYDDFGEGFGEVGTSTPFPESGISVVPWLTGFVGANATAAGLEIAPALPVALVDAQASEVSFAGRARTIYVARAFDVGSQPASNGVERLDAGVALAQTFAPTAAFNEVGVFVGTYATSLSGFVLAVDRADGRGGWTRVAARRFLFVTDNSWVHLALPAQPGGGTYRLTLSDALGSIAWYRLSGGSGASRDGAPLGASFRYRALMAPQRVVVEQSMAGTPDMLHTSLGQTFVSPVPFDRVSLLVGTYVSTTAGFVATLLQDVGGRWARKQVEVFQDVPDNAEVVLHFATQPAGKYLLEISSPNGSIAWYRAASDVYPGDGLYALTDGAPVAGDRWFRVYQGAYRLHVPEDHVDVVLEPGQRYVLPR